MKDTTFGDTDLVKIIKDNTKEDGHVDGTYDTSISYAWMAPGTEGCRPANR
ncbi:MAG: hypothetical protein SPK00_11090 [Corynebacterium glucuronolyticum]|nr:hypothetical protein [Mycobacteriaceae bacterium]MDY5835267.1 hypothetical protein [Corynebacterium glucuronolyticum]